MFLQLCCNVIILLFVMKLKINWDALGITAAVACAIHCAILPLFLSALPLFGVNIIHNVFFEAGMILLAIAIGVYSLWHGIRRHHHRFFPLYIFIAGIVLLISRQFFFHYEYWLLVPAVLLIVSAHYFNWRYCRLANHCHASDCNH